MVVSILSVKPIKRKLFICVHALSSYVAISFWARQARFSIFLRCKNIGVSPFSFVVPDYSFRQFYSAAVFRLRSLLFGWCVELKLIGYLYFTKKFYVRKFRRTALFLRSGFFYNFLILLPRTMVMYWHKSFFTLFSVNLIELIAVAEYLRFTRNLFPYKASGVLFYNERLVLKPGKKTKTK